MALVFGPDNAFFSLRINDIQYTDGYALVTGGLANVEDPLDDIAQQVREAYVEAFQEITWTSSVIGECTVVNDTEVGVATGATTGTGPSGNVASVNTTVLLEKTTAVRGRRGRGRTFLPSVLTEGALFGDGTIQADFLNDVNNRCTVWLQLGVLGSRNHAIPQGETQPRKDGTPGTPPILPWPTVASITADPKAATQRRRMRR